MVENDGAEIAGPGGGSIPPPAATTIKTATASSTNNASSSFRGTPPARTPAARPDPPRFKVQFASTEEKVVLKNNTTTRWDADQDGPPHQASTLLLDTGQNKSIAVAVPEAPAAGELAWIFESLQRHAQKGTEPPSWMLNLAMSRIGGLPAEVFQVGQP